MHSRVYYAVVRVESGVRDDCVGCASTLGDDSKLANGVCVRLHSVAPLAK